MFGLVNVVRSVVESFDTGPAAGYARRSVDVTLESSLNERYLAGAS